MNNEQSTDGIKPSSKSVSTRMPAPKVYRSRLRDMTARIPKWKHPNALKHGVFSACPTIPGEDPREFIELHSALVDEWQPSGPTEHDAVFNLADFMWRKIRAQRFLQSRLLEATLDAKRFSFDEAYGLYLFWLELGFYPERVFEKGIGPFLRPETIKHLNQKFPRSSYQSASQWARAVRIEIVMVLIPAIPRITPPESWEKVDESAEEFRRELADHQMSGAMFDGKDFLEYELNLRERLDAMIARQIKNLIQLKAMKQMLRQSSALREDEQPRKIVAMLPAPQ